MSRSVAATPLCSQISLTPSCCSAWGPRAEPNTCPAQALGAPQQEAHITMAGSCWPGCVALPPAARAAHTGSSCSKEQVQSDTA